MLRGGKREEGRERREERGGKREEERERRKKRREEKGGKRKDGRERREEMREWHSTNPFMYCVCVCVYKSALMSDMVPLFSFKLSN